MEIDWSKLFMFLFMIFLLYKLYGSQQSGDDEVVFEPRSSEDGKLTLTGVPVVQFTT